MSVSTIIEQLFQRYPQLEPLHRKILEATEIIISCYTSGGKLLICGNGGSCSDSEHMVGELMKSFEAKRPLGNEVSQRLIELSGDNGMFLSQKLEKGLPAISLTSQTALITAICNDMDASLIFAQQIINYGKVNDVLIAISTSGNSQNVVNGCIAAKAINMKVIGFTGNKGGKINRFSDILLNVPESRTSYIQELQLPIMHAICLITENHFFSPK